MHVVCQTMQRTLTPIARQVAGALWLVVAHCGQLLTLPVNPETKTRRDATTKKSSRLAQVMLIVHRTFVTRRKMHVS